MLAGTRVLVVEDEALISMMLEDYLLEIGCRVVGTAARVEEALEMARVVSRDVAVLDVNLAGKVSYPVAEILRARNIPFLFATGYGTAGLPVELRGSPVLSKPFLLDQLEKALRASLGL